MAVPPAAQRRGIHDSPVNLCELPGQTPGIWAVPGQSLHMRLLGRGKPFIQPDPRPGAGLTGTDLRCSVHGGR